MFALITFFIGLFVLFKGSFRLGGRTVTQAQARSIALYLMAPLAVYFCASMVIVLNTPNLIQMSDDGNTFAINNDPSLFAYIANTTGVIELITVGIAVLLTLFTIYGAPKTSAPSNSHPLQQSHASATPNLNRPPDIMTVAEAAAYMRVTEKEVLGLIDQGKLGAARIGDSYRIARIAIEDFMGGSAG